MCYDKPTEINTIFYIVLESDLSSLGKHKGAHLISSALLSKYMFISPRLGWIYNTGNKVKCRRFKRAGSWTFKVSLNRLGTSKCLLIYSCVCGGVVVFFVGFFLFFSSPFLEFLNQMKEISSITMLEIYQCFPRYFNKKRSEKNPNNLCQNCISLLLHCESAHLRLILRHLLIR